jgi:Transposase IS116/IS110/IS902 family
MQITQDLESVKRLSKDLRKAAATLSDREARYLVDLYYIWQDHRKRAGSQVRQMSEVAEPHDVIAWVGTQADTLETQIKGALNIYAKANPLGVWSMSITGIGQIISAGLLAHIEIEKAPTAGHIWRFAGLDPTVRWEKKTKRPWNAGLKTLCWHIGESFVKQQSRPSDYYGKLLLERKEYEIARNDRGELADQAVEILRTKNIGKQTDAYKHYSVGKLPPAQIHARAKRWATKLFLSHWHEVAFRFRYGTLPPKPYVLTHVGGHAHAIEIPNYPW